MSFDWSVSAGAVLITVTNLGALIMVAWRLSVRFTIMERRVNLMFAWFLRQITAAGSTNTLTPEEMREFFGVTRPS